MIEENLNFMFEFSTSGKEMVCFTHEEDQNMTEW